MNHCILMTLPAIRSVKARIEKQDLVKNARLLALSRDLCFDKHIAFWTYNLRRDKKWILD